MTPRIALETNTPLVDEALSLRVSGILPRVPVTLRASCTDSSGVTYNSWAEYKASAGALVEPAKQRSLEGSYKGLDAFGLWWSMVSVPERAFQRDLRPIATNVSTEIGGERVAELEFARLRVAPGVRSVAVLCGGLVATLFLPNEATAAAGVMVLGGSEGGIALAEELAALLASNGFAALAVAYFGVPGLPAQLVRIPLEYVENAAQWLLRRPEVSGPGIGVVGTSRGGELALLIGSVFPLVHAVVGFAASSVVWPGFTAGLDFSAAWTRGGKDIPFALPRPQRPRPNSAGPLVCKPWFASALRDQCAIARSMIPTERIRGAVLLVSGGDDRVWPSRVLADLAMRRLASAGGDQTTRRGVHLTYSRAGHAVGRAPGLPAAPTIVASPDGIRHALGGSKAGNAHSAQHSWSRVLSFLSDQLAAPSTAPGRRKRYP